MSEQTYQTNELPLAATLLCYGFPLIEVDSTNPKRAIFNIGVANETNASVGDFVELYWQKRAAIEPSAFYGNLRFLKSRILSNFDAKR